MKTQQLDPDTAPLDAPPPRATPRRLPPLRSPRWLDRAADHPRAWWTVAAVCTAASLTLLAVMAVGGMGPVTDFNGPPGLTPGPAAPTIAAEPFTRPSTAPAAPPPARPTARPSARPTGTTGPTANPDTTPPAPARQAPAEPTPEPTAQQTPPPATAEPEPTPDEGGDPDACVITGPGGGIFHPGEPGYDECRAPNVGPNEH